MHRINTVNSSMDPYVGCSTVTGHEAKMVAKARDEDRLVVALNWLHVSHRWAQGLLHYGRE